MELESDCTHYEIHDSEWHTENLGRPMYEVWVKDKTGKLKYINNMFPSKHEAHEWAKQKGLKGNDCF